MKKLIYVALIFVMFGSCETPEQLGPDIKGIYGPLTVTQAFAVSTATPNFATGSNVYFTAKFENDAIWTITIVGQTSGAVKTIAGVSDELNSSNSIWDGTADDAPSFRVENVIATLSFSNSTSTFTQSISIAGIKNLDAEGVLVTDFNASQVASWLSDWPPSIVTNTSYIRPDGNEYMYMSGTPWQGTPVSPYLDYITINASQADVNYGTYFPLYADPAKVYFNIMVYGTNTPNTWLQITLFEDGVAARSLNIRPEWTGWKQLSYNYTEMPTTLTTAGKPNKVTAIQFVLLSDANPLPGAAVSTAFDHVIFTHNKPYQP